MRFDKVRRDCDRKGYLLDEAIECLRRARKFLESDPATAEWWMDGAAQFMDTLDQESATKE